MFNRIHKGMYWDRALTLVEGCTPVDETCLNCWSAAQSYIRSHQLNPAIRTRHEGLTAWKKDRAAFRGKIRVRPENIDLPQRTKKPTAWAVWNDLFHGLVPDQYIAEALEVMVNNPRHIYLLLTKRARRMREIFQWLKRVFPVESRPHIWLGVTVGVQRHEHRIEDLVEIDAAVRWLSIEPMLGPIVLTPPEYRGTNVNQDAWLQKLSLIVLGGETGRRARPMHPDWPRTIRDRCLGRTDMGRPWALPFFFKAWGKKAAGRLLDGREWNELPKGWL